MLIPASFLTTFKSHTFTFRDLVVYTLGCNYVLNGIRFGIDRKNYMRLKSFGKGLYVESVIKICK